MNLSAVCIRRPVFTTMLCALPIVLGIFSYRRLGVDLQPKLDLPFVFVTTTLRGASVEEMETQVTRPIEEAVNTIEGIDELRSTTSEGVSRVFIRFVLEKSPDVAAQEVQNKVNAMLAQLPAGHDPAGDRQVRRGRGAGDDGGRLGPARPPRGDRDRAAGRSRRSSRRSPAWGPSPWSASRPRTVQVTVDTDQLNQFGLSIEDVRRALATQNLELPGGRVDQGKRELVLRMLGRYRRPPSGSTTWSSPPGGATRSGSATSATPRSRSRTRGPWPGSTASRPSA